VSWNQCFFDPIIVPGRTPLVTLRDAARYIMRLPKANQLPSDRSGFSSVQELCSRLTSRINSQKLTEPIATGRMPIRVKPIGNPALMEQVMTQRPKAIIPAEIRNERTAFI
jgi:hypothetical protein